MESVSGTTWVCPLALMVALVWAMVTPFITTLTAKPSDPTTRLFTVQLPVEALLLQLPQTVPLVGSWISIGMLEPE